MRTVIERKIVSERETEQFASELSLLIKPGMSVGLSGDLGAGKTTLVRYLVAVFGSRHEVSSPSYVLEHRYVLQSGEVVSHWDLYRLNSAPEELLEPPPSDEIRIVEWPEKAPEIVSLFDLLITITVSGGAGETVNRLVKVAARE